MGYSIHIVVSLLKKTNLTFGRMKDLVEKAALQMFLWKLTLFQLKR